MCMTQPLFPTTMGWHSPHATLLTTKKNQTGVAMLAQKDAVHMPL